MHPLFYSDGGARPLAHATFTLLLQSGPRALYRHPASDLQRNRLGPHISVLSDPNNPSGKVVVVRNGLDGRGGLQALRLPCPARTGNWLLCFSRPLHVLDLNGLEQVHAAVYRAGDVSSVEAMLRAQAGRNRSVSAFFFALEHPSALLRRLLFHSEHSEIPVGSSIKLFKTLVGPSFLDEKK